MSITNMHQELNALAATTACSQLHNSAMPICQHNTMRDIPCWNQGWSRRGWRQTMSAQVHTPGSIRCFCLALVYAAISCRALLGTDRCSQICRQIRLLCRPWQASDLHAHHGATATLWCLPVSTAAMSAEMPCNVMWHHKWVLGLGLSCRHDGMLLQHALGPVAGQA